VVRRDLLNADFFRPLGFVGQPGQQPAETFSGGHLALPARAVLCLQDPGSGELVGAAKLIRVGLELEQQAADSLARGLDAARFEIDQFALHAVAEGAPAVLGQPLRLVNGQPLSALVAGGKRCHQCLPDRRNRGGVRGSGLHVGDP
jgi:hypothetical protein